MNPEQIGCSPGYAVALFGPDSSLPQFLESMDRLHAIGFRNFGIEILEPEHISIYQQPGAVDKLIKKAEATQIRLNHFPIWHCCANLSSSDTERRRLGVRQFAEGVEVATQLGIPLVTIGSDWPPEWVSSYNADYNHAPASDFFLPSTAVYEEMWRGHCQAIRECLEIAEKANLRLGFEPRANSFIANVDAFLRLSDALGSDRLGCILDAMHSAYHRENVPIAIKKLGSRLVGLQLSGTDGKSMVHLPIESGDPFVKEVIDALKTSNFTGTVDVELYGMPAEQVDACYLRARQVLEQL